MTCRTCKFYDLGAVQDKAGRVRRDRVAHCLWRAPAIAWPDSLPGYSPPIPRMAMEPDDGEECPAWQERV